MFDAIWMAPNGNPASILDFVNVMNLEGEMPTDDANLARVLRALISVGDVSCEETEVHSLGRIQKGYRLTVANASIVIDQQHEASVQKLLDP